MAETSRTVPVTAKVSIALQILGAILALVAGIVAPAPNAGGEQIWVLIGVVVTSLLFAKGIHDGNRLVRLIMSGVAVISVVLIVFDLLTGEIGFTLPDIFAFAGWDIGVLLLWLPSSRPHFLLGGGIAGVDDAEPEVE
jgi:hypothetical protein